MQISLHVPRPHSELPLQNLMELADLSANTPRGAFLELGVYKGGSAWFLYQVAEQQTREIYLFDTFSGLPFESDDQIIKAGRFGDTSVEEIKAWCPNAKIVKGLFPESLPPDLPALSFVHVDCDLKNGCQAALDHLWPKLVDGGIMAFDDWGFPGIQGPVLKRFSFSKVRFTENRIPYLVKGEE